MKALTLKWQSIFFYCLTVCLLGFTPLLHAQTPTKETRKATIITTKIANGQKTVEVTELTGEDASQEAIDKLVEAATKEGKSIDVNIEEILEGESGTDIKEILKEYDIEAIDKGDGEIEITIDDDDEEDQQKKKVTRKEVKIIKMKGDQEEVDIEELLKEHDIDLEDGEKGEKQVHIIKRRGDKQKEGEKDTQVKIIKMKGGDKESIEEILKEHDIDLDEEELLEHKIIKMGDGDNEQILIFQGEDGKQQIIKKSVEEKIKKMGIVLPSLSPPIANYVNAVASDKLIFLAGKGPTKADGTRIKGKVGKDLTVEEGYQAARLAGINQLAALKATIGDLNRVKRIVKVLGMVNATGDFTDHPEVINGFSDLMVEVFGDRGKHARAAVGMYSLPRNMAVEVEMIVEIE